MDRDYSFNCMYLWILMAYMVGITRLMDYVYL